MDRDFERIFADHTGIIKRNRFLYRTYLSWYESFARSVNPIENKKVLELGSGNGFFKELYPSVITSDVIALPNCDIICLADALPFKNKELDAVFLLNTLHHIPDVTRFFDEASRVLSDDGIIYITEPSNTPFSRFIYKNFHHEPFNTKQIGWELEAVNPLFNCNQALCWIIFHRDKKQFNKLFPNLLVERRFLHTPFRYLLSGGHSVQPFLPSWCYPTVNFLEQILYPFNRFLALFETVVIRKKSLNDKESTNKNTIWP